MVGIGEAVDRENDRVLFTEYITGCIPKTLVPVAAVGLDQDSHADIFEVSDYAVKVTVVDTVTIGTTEVCPYTLETALLLHRKDLLQETDWQLAWVTTHPRVIITGTLQASECAPVGDFNVEGTDSC